MKLNKVLESLNDRSARVYRTIKSFLEEESGETIEKMDIWPDPENDGVWAVRVNLNGNVVDLVIDV